MLQVGELFNIGPFKCRVSKSSQRPNLYWIFWSDNSFIEYLKLVGSTTDNLSYYTQINLKKLDSSIIYKELSLPDSPDFFDLKNLTRYVELLRTYLIAKQIKILK